MSGKKSDKSDSDKSSSFKTKIKNVPIMKKVPEKLAKLLNVVSCSKQDLEKKINSYAEEKKLKEPNGDIQCDTPLRLALGTSKFPIKPKEHISVLSLKSRVSALLVEDIKNSSKKNSIDNKKKKSESDQDSDSENSDSKQKNKSKDKNSNSKKNKSNDKKDKNSNGKVNNEFNKKIPQIKIDLKEFEHSQEPVDTNKEFHRFIQETIENYRVREKAINKKYYTPDEDENVTAKHSSKGVKQAWEEMNKGIQGITSSSDSGSGDSSDSSSSDSKSDDDDESETSLQELQVRDSDIDTPEENSDKNIGEDSDMGSGIEI